MSKTPRQRPGGEKTLSANVEGLQVGDASQAGKSGKSKETKKQSPEQAESQTAETPKYAQMLRMEGRLREDQVDALAKIRRRVSADRDDKSERITDNTLLRVAVDLLVEHADELAGENEDELRASVTDQFAK